jgi:DNA-binding IclR family transcriptional regulator
MLFGRLSEGAEALRQMVRPHLQNLASHFNETASLAYLFEDRIQVLDTVETFHEIRVINRTGRILPPHCSSMGKAITAHQSRDLIDRMLETYGLTKRTERSIVDRQSLLAEFEKVQHNGFAVDREESMAGGICIGGPIFLTPARVVAAISVSTPVVRMTTQREREVCEQVKSVAERVSRELQKSDPTSSSYKSWVQTRENPGDSR